MNDVPDVPPPTPRFVAVANGTYVDHAFLERAVPDARALAVVLDRQHGFATVVLEDYDRGRLLDAVDEHLATNAIVDGALILIWIGHAIEGPNHSLRLLGSSDKKDNEIVEAEKLGEWAARTGARQVLVLIDTCYSGKAVIDALKLARAVDGNRVTAGTTWFSAVAASLGDEPALSGALVRTVTRLLREGPSLPNFQWDPSRPTIDAGEVVQAILRDWDEKGQRPTDSTSGLSLPFVRNPLYVPGSLDQPVEHLLFAARGTTGEHSYFSGRETVLGAIVAWIRAGKPGLYLLTGPPGCGKSAVAGRIVSLSATRERARLLADGATAHDLDPGAGSVDAHLHVRGVTLDTAAEKLARQLDVGTPYLDGLLDLARRRRAAGDPLVVVIDGLDEARSFASDVAVQLVARLAVDALVFVATRDVGDAAGTTLIDRLGPVAQRFDLGSDAGATQRDVAHYVEQRLEQRSATMDPAVVAAVLARKVGEVGTPFLLARLVTSQLREQPVDTSAPHWELALAATVESALERDLQGLVLEVDGVPDPAAARDLMTALALSRGGGLPADDLWPGIARAIAGRDVAYDTTHAFAVLEGLGRHIVAGREGEQPVYRLAHQQLVDYLAPPETLVDSGGRAPPLRTAVAQAVFAQYVRLLDAHLKPREHAYLWRYGWYHLGEGGDAGLDAMRALADRDRTAFLPDLARALNLAAERAAASGALGRAATLCRDAVAVLRSLDEPRLLASSLFQLSAVLAGAGETDAADEASSEAIDIARAARDELGGDAFLSATLINQAVSRLGAGLAGSVKRLADEALSLLDPATVEPERLWPLRAAALSLASRAALMMGDAQTAGLLATATVESVDRIADAQVRQASLVDALASVVVARVLLVIFDQADETKPVAACTDDGERLVALHRAACPRHAVADVAMARGLIFHARAQIMDRARALPVVASDDETRALVDEGVALVSPFVAEVADAATMLANALILRAALQAVRAPEAAAADGIEARRVLERFADRNGAAAAMLGELLDGKTAQSLPAALASPTPDWAALEAQQRAAIALLRRHRLQLNAPLLARALMRLVAILQQRGAAADVLIPVQAEAIDAWRAVPTTVPDAITSLAWLMSDQAALMLRMGDIAADDLTRDALALATTTEGPQREPLLAQVRLNRAAWLMVLGDRPGARELLGEVIATLEFILADRPEQTGPLATAYGNLAQLDVMDHAYATAETAARRALALYDTGVVGPLVVVNRWMAQLALGSALRGLGDEAQGLALVREVVDPQRDAVIAGTVGVDHLAHLLNTSAPDLWDAVLDDLTPHPVIARQLAMLRARSPDAIAATVKEFSQALATAHSHDIHGLRSLVRMHRARAPERFDAQWRAETGALPDWIHLDRMLLATVVTWLRLSNPRLGHDYFGVHRTLLDPSVDIVLDEMRALDPSNEATIDFHRTILDVARIDGIDAAYAPLLLKDEIAQWLQSENLARHLEEHQELLRPEIASAMNALALDNRDLGLFAAILTLAQRGEQRVAFRALEAPASAVELLAAAIRTPDMTRLVALATLVAAGTDDAAIGRTARTALAIGLAVNGAVDGAVVTIDAAAGEADATALQAMSDLVAGAVAHHRRAATTLAQLLDRIDAAGYAFVT